MHNKKIEMPRVRAYKWKKRDVSDPIIISLANI